MYTFLISTLAVVMTLFLTPSASSFIERLVSQQVASMQAAAMVNKAQQLLAATKLFRADVGRWPDSVSELVKLGYLQTRFLDDDFAWRIPASSVTLRWAKASSGDPIFFFSSTALTKACPLVNLMTRGDNGVLRGLYSPSIVQCAADSNGTLIVVANAADAPEMQSYASTVQAPLFETLPQDPNSPVWAIAPSSTNDTSELWVNPASEEGYVCANFYSHELSVSGGLLATPGGPLNVNILGPAATTYFSTLTRATLLDEDVPISNLELVSLQQPLRTELQFQGAYSGTLTAGARVGLVLEGTEGKKVTCYYEAR